MEVTLQFKLPAKVAKRRHLFLASCPVLDVHSQGETEKEARENLVEALTVFFISCFERETLDAVLKECGFKPHRAYKRKTTSPTPQTYINVLIPFFVTQRSHHECHA
jgi:hypothetical protein